LHIKFSIKQFGCADPARAAVSYVVLEPFGLRDWKWGLPLKMQGKKKCQKTCGKKQGRPDISERPRSAALLARSFSPLPVPTGGSDFSP
jgi:hypothetical protein